MNNVQSDYAELVQLVGKPMSLLIGWIKRHASEDDYKIIDGVIVYISDKLQRELIDRFYDDGKPNQEWCSVSELARRVGVTQRTVSWWIKASPLRYARTKRTGDGISPRLIPPALQIEYTHLRKFRRVKRKPKNSTPMKLTLEKTGYVFLNNRIGQIASGTAYKGTLYIGNEDHQRLVTEYSDLTTPINGYIRASIVARELGVTVKAIKCALAARGHKCKAFLDPKGGSRHTHLSPEQARLARLIYAKLEAKTGKILMKNLPIQNDRTWNSNKGVRTHRNIVYDAPTPLL